MARKSKDMEADLAILEKLEIGSRVVYNGKIGTVIGFRNYSGKYGKVYFNCFKTYRDYKAVTIKFDEGGKIIGCSPRNLTIL